MKFCATSVATCPTEPVPSDFSVLVGALDWLDCDLYTNH